MMIRISGFLVITGLLLILYLGSITCATDMESLIETTDTKEKIFYNGTIYTDGTNSTNSLLVKQGVVQELGVDPDEILDAIRIDLNGTFIYPGFSDSHVHLVEAGYGFSSGCFLYGATDADAICAIVKPIAEKLPSGEPMFGGGFSLENYDNWSLEDRNKLDLVTGDRPVFLGDQLGHNAIVNSAALKLANITAQTTSPPGGVIICEDGEPTGMLRESAMTLVGNVLFDKFSDSTIEAVSKHFLDTWASFGYTSINDLSGFSGGRMLRPDMLRKMEKEGNLSVRVNYLYTLFSLDEIDDALQYLGNDTPMVRYIGLKIFVDGAYAAGQAWTSWENQEGNHGLSYVYRNDEHGSAYNLSRIIERAEELGLNVHYHVQGDEAIDAVLSPLEEIYAKNHKLNGTHTLIHLAFVTDDQIKRIAQFNGKIVMTVQPAFWHVESDLTRYYGDRYYSSYPLKELFDSGVPVGISTDFGVSPLAVSPPTAIMNISLLGGENPTVIQPLTREDVIRGLTTGSAATAPFKDVGKLTEGYDADMVVYDQDLYSVPTEAITNQTPKVLATYIRGNAVYDSKNLLPKIF